MADEQQRPPTAKELRAEAKATKARAATDHGIFTAAFLEHGDALAGGGRRRFRGNQNSEGVLGCLADHDPEEAVVPPPAARPASARTGSIRLSAKEDDGLEAIHFTYARGVPTNRPSGGRRTFKESAEPPEEVHKGRRPLNPPAPTAKFATEGKRAAPAAALITQMGATLRQPTDAAQKEQPKSPQRASTPLELAMPYGPGRLA